MPHPRLLVVVLLLSLITAESILPAAETTGSVVGTVVYQADADRPWRYSRHYVHGTDGHLAEAVVALSGAPLRVYRNAKVKPVPHTIDQAGFQFVPETTAVRVGDPVTFKNSDGTLHNVQTTAGDNPFNVNTLPDDDYTHHFTRAGGVRRPVRVGCAFHGGMRAWVFVFNHPFFKVTEKTGRFEFRDVPPGSYQLQLVHPAGQLKWTAEVKVEAGKSHEVQITVSPDNKDLKP